MEASLESAPDLALATPVSAPITRAESSSSPNDAIDSVLSALSSAFAEPFALVDAESGVTVHSDVECLSCDLYELVELLAEVSRLGKPEIVDEVAPLTMLAIPLRQLGVGRNLIAVGVFVTSTITDEDEIAAAARAFGVDAQRAMRWAKGRSTWSATALERMAATVLDNLNLRAQKSRLLSEVADAAAHTDDIYAELDLLHRLTGQLHLSENEQELWQNALKWLSNTIPAQCLSIIMRASPEGDLADDKIDHWQLLTHGEPPTDRDELCELIRRFGAAALQKPVLLNRPETRLPTWHCPTIRELVCVPIEGGDQPSGWLLALNHLGESESSFSDFGSVEIQLLSSVGTILGIHNSNLGLYREQSELFASSVQALTSAIDAKDPYTSGHSNRVAYFSVALAEQMGLSKADCDTLYLAGLLHDIGKIGIDDNVLNKPGQLTDEEYEQIKLHPQLGYEILKGVRQLDKVLPIVLHHHESWDGSGYPHGLKGEAIPKMARIMAVADAFDAMSSNRPYRQGMPDEKLDRILHAGAGKHWDAEVVEAFFAIREEIRRIAEVSACQTSLEQQAAVK